MNEQELRDYARKLVIRIKNGDKALDITLEVLKMVHQSGVVDGLERAIEQINRRQDANPKESTN